MGVLTPHRGMIDGFAHPPIIISGICFAAKSPSKNYPTAQKSYLKFRNSRTTCQKCNVWKKCGAPKNFGIVEFLYLCYMWPYIKFWNPRTIFKNIPLFLPKRCVGRRGGLGLENGSLNFPCSTLSASLLFGRQDVHSSFEGN